jgi:DNA invertase Pin-like site-specific DNA recombinase
VRDERRDPPQPQLGRQRLDRLGRTAKGLTSLFDDLIRWKVNLVSLKDGLDLSTPAGRLMANILALNQA